MSENIFIFLLIVGLDFYIFLLMLSWFITFTAYNEDAFSSMLKRVTAPVIKPLHAIVPNYKGIVLAPVLAALIIALIKLGLQGYLIIHQLPHLGGLLLWALTDIIEKSLSILFYALIIVAIMSWINPVSRHPVILLIKTLVEPILHIARRYIPPVSGLDLSFLVVVVLIQLTRALLMAKLANVAAALALGQPAA